MRTLQEIKKEDEKILQFTTTSAYYEKYLLCDEETDLERADIGAIFEYTLHRMKESSFNDEEINYNSNMYIPSDEEWEDLEEYEEYMHVDLGYIINGLINTVEEVEI